MTDLDLYFRFKCEKGLEAKGLASNPEYRKRLDYEIGVIIECGFPGYFLVVSDLLNWARTNQIPIGPGRGSSAGSLAVYCLEITQLDPIKYGLIFERFLSTSRVAPPDIDLDICELRRNEVISYVEEKYGKEQVSHIGTVGTLKAKGAIRDIARTLGLSYDLGDKLAKMTLEPIEGKPQPLTTCYEKVVELKNLRWGEPSDAKTILEWAEKVEERPRHVGVHPSGILISDQPISQVAPLYLGKDGVVATQWDMRDVEEVGLVKFDFLGLRALTTIDRCLKLIKKNYGKDIDIRNVSVDDPKVYKLLQAGDTAGLFQIETSGGMKDLLIQIRPTCLEDLAMLLAIYRPGPLCLSGDTKILTCIDAGASEKTHRNFAYKNIKDIYENWQKKEKGLIKNKIKNIFSFNSFEKKLEKNKIKKVFKSGEKPVYKIKIQTGLSSTNRKYVPRKRCQRKTEYIKSTLEHRFLTLDGWKQLKELEVGEYIAIVHHSCFGAKRSKKNTYGLKNFQNIAFRNYKYQCIFCSWDKGSLDVNHDEGNRKTNNDPSNLSFLCPNHHRLFTEGKISLQEIKKEKEKFKLPYNDQIMFVKYIGLEYSGIEETFDLEVGDPHHNFIAGDFIVHNSSNALQHYLQVRSGETTPSYLVPELEPILKRTDGFLIYQEQILEICKELAGFTLFEADLVRKAVGKKLLDKMIAQQEKFVKGCIKNGISERNAKAIFEDIKGFASYGFVKAHAISYSYITYLTAWLKTYYPLELICACLISDSDESDKIIQYINHCQEKGIFCLGPSVNESETGFSVTPDKKAIRFGLSAVKNLGKPVSEIIRERENRGPFTSILDFCNRMDLSKFNKKKLESLVLAGAFDSTGGWSRASLLGAIDNVLEYKEENKKYESKNETFLKRMAAFEVRQNEIALYDADPVSFKKRPPMLKFPEEPIKPVLPSIPKIEELPTMELLRQEKELLGYYLSGHPLDEVIEKSKITISMIKENAGTKQRVFFIAIPSSIEEITTKKKKQKMAYLVLEDKTGTIQGIIFPKQFSQYSNLIDLTTPAKYEGEVEITETDVGKSVKLMILSITELPSMKVMDQKPVNAVLDLSKAEDIIKELVPGGTIPVNLKIKSSEQSYYWDFGDFNCQGNRLELLRKLSN